ncbi:MAG TPA: alpha/beta hydrolase [Candidatus Angelobacter sp.]
MKAFAKRMLFLIIGLYLALVVVAILLSDRLIFLPHPSSYQDGPEITKLTTRTGKKISAIYLANPTAKFTLLISHGNAEDLGDDRFWLDELHRAGFSILAYDYDGYGTSEGKAGEQAAYDDEGAAYDYLTATRRIPADSIIIYGRSVGSGPAVHLAARKPVAGLILQSPFVSAFRVLTRIPLLPFDKFPNYKDIRNVHCPLLIIHGDSDTVIPSWHGKKLYELANEPKKYVPVPGADHNDLQMVAGKSYMESLQQFVESINQARSRKLASSL